MASIIRKGLGKVVDKVVDLTAEILPRDGTSNLNKAWRARILLNRATSGKEKDSSKREFKTADMLNKHTTKTMSAAGMRTPWTVIHFKSRNKSTSPNSPDSIDDSLSITYANEPITKPQGEDNMIYLVNTMVSPYQALTLQARPISIDINPTSNWVSVNSMGRNNPFTMYTGGNDTITFEVIWYATNPNDPTEVIKKCRLLEAWSKANGYNAAPPVISLLWGKSEMFSNDYFIVESCPYKLKNFVNFYRNYDPDNHDEFGSRLRNYTVNDGRLLPAYAVQNLTLRRVSSENRTYPSIIGASLDELKTSGVVNEFSS